MKLVDFLRPEAVIAELSGDGPPAVLAQLARPVAQVFRLEERRLVEVLLEREKLGSTGVGEGVAIPHAKVPGLPALAASLGRSLQGVDFKAIDGRPTRLFLALFAPESAAGSHLQALARVSRIFKSASFREALLAAPDAAAMWRLVQQEDSRD
ncbi:MAG TPA: PTS sugar transporter subunit IIA [Anaeromyxobacteraceae bacterium]|nr:PTS sugar transporter subunit IIA [Anaeromyxobacteraceae bacterium]